VGEEGRLASEGLNGKGNWRRFSFGEAKRLEVIFKSARMRKNINWR